MSFIFHRVFLWLGGFMIAHAGDGQVFVETYPPTGATEMGVRITGLGNLSDRLSYDKISGSPFWRDEWQLATLYGSNEREKWLCKVKLDFASGEVYYIDKNENEQSANDGLIKKIVFHTKEDTASVAAVFILSPQPVKLNQEVRNTYLQVLSTGPYEFLKLNKRTLSSADSLFGTLKRYFFTTENNYFINHNELLMGMKKLDKDNVLSLLPGASAFADWIKQNKINFRKEEDVTALIDYYNSKK